MPFNYSLCQATRVQNEYLPWGICVPVCSMRSYLARFNTVRLVTNSTSRTIRSWAMSAWEGCQNTPLFTHLPAKGLFWNMRVHTNKHDLHCTEGGMWKRSQWIVQTINNFKYVSEFYSDLQRIMHYRYWKLIFLKTGKTNQSLISIES